MDFLLRNHSPKSNQKTSKRAGVETQINFYAHYHACFIHSPGYRKAQLFYSFSMGNFVLVTLFSLVIDPFLFVGKMIMETRSTNLSQDFDSVTD